MKSLLTLLLLLATLFVCSIRTNGQMRQVYLDNVPADNNIRKISFLSPATGYVAFTKWIGYTTDSGHTFIKKYITTSNVDYNAYKVNLTFGFGITGVKAISADTLLAYGHYGFVPSILYSTDAGNSYTLIYQSEANAQQFTEGITDMVFPKNTNIGYAVEADRIIKTTNRGKSWYPVYYEANSFFKAIESVDDNTVFGISDSKLVRTTDGASWMKMLRPAGDINYACFTSANKGWLNIQDNLGVYYTENGGNSWVLKNNPDVNPYGFTKMKFMGDSTGYAIAGLYTVLKTTDTGKIWQPLPRDNNYSYLGFTHNDLFVYSSNWFWAGGGQGFLEFTSNGGGRPLPRSYFSIDTSGVYNTQIVKLVNYSRKDYQYKWYKNNILISTSYNATYNHDIYNSGDTIKLVVIDGANTDTSVKYQYFIPAPRPTPPAIKSFSPVAAGSGTTVTIKGINFTGTTSVSFGGTAANSFTIVSDSVLTVVVGAGSSGAVSVTNQYGTAIMNGFVFTTRLAVYSVDPRTAAAGSSILITGTNFDPVTSNNIVYVGNVRADVLTASPGTLSVRVPKGISIAPVTVTANGATATSNLPFEYTYPGPDSITTNSWNKKKEFSSPFNCYRMVTADLDGDGKPEIITGDEDDNGLIGVRQNTSTVDNLSFVQYPQSPNNSNRSGVSPVAVGDVDGDGLQDVVTLIYTGMRVYKNTSTPGTISFAPRLTFSDPAGGTQEEALAISDLDGDGRPEVIYNNVFNTKIFKNTSSTGNVSFTVLPEYTVPTYYGYFVQGKPMARDMDGDNKPDLVVIKSDGLYVFQNTSLPGSISFASPKYFSVATQAYVSSHITGDLDGDGKPEVVMQIGANTLAVARNTSTPGNISFASIISPAFTTTYEIRGLAIADLNGDTKDELIAAINNSYAPTGKDVQATIFQNRSKPGTLFFGTGVDIAIDSVNNNTFTVVVADFNADGKPDLGTGNDFNGNYSILLNQSFTGVQVCAGGSVSLQTTRTGATYLWQQKFGEVFYNMADTPNVSGTHSPTLQLTSVPRSWNNYAFRCKVDGSSDIIYQLTVDSNVVASVKIFYGDSVICDGSQANFNATVVNGGSAPFYQWLVNGMTMASGTSDTFNSSSLHNGDSVAVKMASNAACALPDTAISRKMGIVVKPVVTPSVAITATDSVICTGKPVTFTANPLNQGTYPTYKWQKNGIKTGSNSPTYSDSMLMYGDKITVVLTSNASCPSTPVVQSAPVNMIVNPYVPLNITIEGETTVNSGQPTALKAITTNAGSTPVYQWQDSTQTKSWTNISGSNSATLNYTPVATGNKVRCLITGNEPCSSPRTDTSNTLTFTLNVTTGILSPNDPSGIRYYPNPVTATLYLDGLKISDGWSSLEIVSIEGSKKMRLNEITRQTALAINTGSLPNGMYMAILTKKSGERSFFTFMKVN
jgi:photosystem II stability/assembly factor-like uncharacterized protein